MADHLEEGHSRNPRVPKCRSSRACQSCRAAKTKCETVTGESQCRRCISTSTVCFFPASRRGRIRGSKNRRTLEKLRNGEMSSLESSDLVGSGTAPEASGSIDDDVSSESEYRDSEAIESSFLHDSAHLQPMSESINVDQSFDGHSTRVHLRQKTSRQSGTATPWNPHNLATNIEGRHQIHRPTLARKLLQILGEFPVEDNQSEDGRPDAKGLQDPLWLVAGLAERGWSVHDKQENWKRKKQQPTVLKSTGLPEEDARLLRKWTAQELRKIEREQNQFWEHGIFGSKCDVARDLDPVHHGLLTEAKATELLQVYFDIIYPQWAMLDPELHTLSYVRSRSALLTTALLALGSTALATLPSRTDEQVAESQRLHSHVEKLNLVVYATGARSIDIVQAQILLCRWGASPKVRLDEQRWMRAGMIPRMAAEIGLNLPRHYGANSSLDEETVERLRRNDLRTRAFLIMNEYRFYTHSGRRPMDLSDFELTDTELDEITRQRGDHFPLSVVALYHLFLFDRDVRQRLEQYQPGLQSNLSLDAELEHIKSYIERWIMDWCPRNGNVDLFWHLIHDALSSWLLLAITIARKRAQPSNMPQDQLQTQQQHQLLLSLSIRLFKEALKVKHALRTTHRAAIFPVAASIILRLSSRRDLVLRTALRMAGDPEKPAVPTFVREAGHQMLIMLCTNNLRSPTPQGESDKSQSSSDNSEAVAADETVLAPEADEEEHHPQPEQTPLQPNGEVHDLQGFPAQDAPFGPQDDSSNIFAFNFADFPYIPGPTEPQTQSQDSMYPPYLAANLDSWMGPANLPNFASAERSSQGVAIQDIGNAGPQRTPFLNNGYSLPLDGMASSHNHPPDISTWHMDNLSPVNHPAFAASSSGSPGNDSNTQREALLTAVRSLIELASLMQ